MIQVIDYKAGHRIRIVAVIALALSMALIAVIFQRWGPKTDLQAYTLALVALLLGSFASVRFYPLRKEIKGRILCTFSILVTAFWALDFFGGIAFFTLDKLIRHFQKS